MEDADQPTTRVARADDEAEIRKCIEAAYSPYVERLGKPPAPALDDYRQRIGRGVVRVVTRGDRIDGLIVTWPERDHFYVNNVAVHPDAQRAGIGATLLAEADKQAQRSSHGEIRLYTNAMMVENIGYYARQGFVETHRAIDASYERVYFSRQLSAQRKVV